MSHERTPAPAARREYAVWAFVLLVGAGAATFWFADLRSLPAAGSAFHLPWILLVVAFFAAEAWGGVHLRLRGQEQTIGVGEIPLVLGLLFCSPTGLVTATVVGSGCALLVQGRRAPVKLAFNLGLFALSAGVAAAVFHPLVGTVGTLGPRVWGAAIVAALAADLVAFLMLTGIISLTSGTPGRRDLVGMLAFGSLETLATSIVALLPATVLVFDARAAWLLAVPTVSLVMAVRAVARKQVLTDRVDRLYDQIRHTRLSPRLDERARQLLESARELFDVEHAELVLFEPDSVMRYSTGARGSTVALVEGGDGDRRLLELVGERSVMLELPGERDPEAIAALESRGLVRMVVTALRGDDDHVGLLLVGDRNGRLDSAAQDDLLRFEAFAAHANAALQLARLLELQGQLHRDARRDPLTGLGNRLHYREMTELALAGGSVTAVLYVDIVDFKLVNGRLGHVAGDQALGEIANRLVGALPAGDVVARLGGDEFACVLHDVGDAGQAIGRARRIVHALDDGVLVGGQSFLLRPRIGIAVSAPAATPESLLTEADLALHEAEEQGSEQIVVFREPLRDAAGARRRLEDELRRGIGAGELEAHYQPLIDLASGRLLGFEALVRWRHPERGLLGPGVFLPTAEQSGLVGQLGREVLRQACAQARRFTQLAPSSRLVMSVNLSAAQLNEHDLARFVQAELDRAGIAPERLWLEITETIAMEDVALTTLRLEELRAVGVQLALDDFGTGYSSLSYLRQFPFSILKIARELLSGADQDSDDAILEAIVLLAARFDMQTVAEGIEQPAQAERARALGCSFGQGFLWSRPLAAADAEGLVLGAADADLAA